MIPLVNINGFSPNLVYALILWRSAFRLLIGNFLTEFSATDMSMFSVLDNNFSIYQWIFTKLNVCIDIVDICFGIANGRMSSIFDSYTTAELNHELPMKYPPMKSYKISGHLIAINCPLVT